MSQGYSHLRAPSFFLCCISEIGFWQCISGLALNPHGPCLSIKSLVYVIPSWIMRIFYFDTLDVLSHTILSCGASNAFPVFSRISFLDSLVASITFLAMTMKAIIRNCHISLGEGGPNWTWLRLSLNIVSTKVEWMWTYVYVFRDLGPSLSQGV